MNVISCDRAISNLVYIAVLVSDLWAMAGKNGTVFETIGCHLECVIQTELIVELELALIERKQSRRLTFIDILA